MSFLISSEKIERSHVGECTYFGCSWGSCEFTWKEVNDTWNTHPEREYKYNSPEIAQAAFNNIIEQLNSGVCVVQIPTDKEAEELLKSKEVKNE